MSEITVRVLAEDEWETYRSVRLMALSADPDAFADTYAEEAEAPESLWHDRMRRSERFIAYAEDGTPIGVVSVAPDLRKRSAIKGDDVDDEAYGAVETAELFGLWVTPDRRGTGVAGRLARTALRHARSEGKSHIAYWVGSDNFRAVAFASGLGFRPTGTRREMREQSADDEDEVAMVLPLTEDRGFLDQD